MSNFERGTGKDEFLLAAERNLLVPFMMGFDIRRPPFAAAPIPAQLTRKEKDDNSYARSRLVPPVSWLWPASFFKAERPERPARAAYTGQPLHEAYDGVGAAIVAEWYDRNPSYFVKTPITSLAETELQAGDVVIFGGHSLIATGDRDEVTHMWWNRKQQRYMWYHNGKTEPGATIDKDYGITRDSLAELVERWRGYKDGVGFWKRPTHYRLREEYRHLGDFSYLNRR